MTRHSHRSVKSPYSSPLKIHRGAVCTFALEASDDMAHPIVAAALLDRDSLLVIELARYIPPPWRRDGDDDDDE